MPPSFLAREDCTAGELTRVLPRTSCPTDVLYFVHQPNPHVPRRVTALRDDVLEYFAAHPLTSL